MRRFTDAEIDAYELEMLKDTDPCVWAVESEVQLQGGQYSLKDHEWQKGPFQSIRKHKVVKKGAQLGFALDVETPIFTPDKGFIRMADVEEGQLVFGTDGCPYPVTAVSPVFQGHECYRVVFSDGSFLIADAAHLWTLTQHLSSKKGRCVTVSTQDMAGRFKQGNRNIYALDLPQPLQMVEGDLSIDPYVLGLWLGDGHSYSAQITASHRDADFYHRVFKDKGIDHLVRNFGRTANVKLNGYHGVLRQLGVLKNKHIPSLCLSFEQRLELLQGLMDSDGYVDKNGSCFFYNTNERLLDGVRSLICSIGLKCRKSIKCEAHTQPGIANDKPIHCKKQWCLYFKAYNDLPICKLPRKLKRLSSGGRLSETRRRRIVAVEPVATRPTKCLAIDSSDSLYLAGLDLIPTHNTEVEVLRALHGLIKRFYPKGVLYLFPDADSVQDFSKARFGPLIQNNPVTIGRYVRNTDSTSIKQVGPTGFLYLRGARLTANVDGAKKDSAKLRSIPVDCVKLDERDLMEDGAVAMAIERMAHSKVKELVEFSTPTVPGYGIDKAYDESDQGLWMIRCQACNRDTCLEAEFPSCVKDGRRVCVYCGAEIFSRNGQWVASYPDRRIEGHWLSQLNSPCVEPGEILRLYNDPPNGNLQEVCNSKLAMAYINAEDELTKADVRACCGLDPCAMSHKGPCAMGIDVGSNLHITIGCRIDKDRYKIVRVLTLTDFNDVHDLAIKYNVKSCVIDALPETRTVRAFQAQESYEVFLCYYKESQATGPSFNLNTGLVQVNRTEICDQTHNLITTKDRCLLPRWDSRLDEYATQMASMFKILVTNPVTNEKVYRYRHRGPDHYRHSTNYFYMAAQRIGIVTNSCQRRQTCADNDYSVLD